MFIKYITGIEEQVQNPSLPGLDSYVVAIEARYLQVVPPDNPLNPVGAISLGHQHVKLKYPGEPETYFHLLDQDHEESGFAADGEGESTVVEENVYTAFHKEWTVEVYAWAQNMKGRNLFLFVPHTCNEGYNVMGRWSCKAKRARMTGLSAQNTKEARNITATFKNMGVLAQFQGSFPIAGDPGDQSSAITAAKGQIDIIKPVKVWTHRGELIDLTTIDQETAESYINDPDFPYLIPLA
ncbi:MAG: hypothetical protein AAF740_01625 [Bacteroidota bacterium]